MTKNRKPIDGKTRKKMEKEVKKGQKNPTPEKKLRTDTLTVKKALDQYPKDIKKKEKALIDSTVEGMKIKKKQNQSHQSKRTSPDEVDHHESPPAHIHKEGGRWEKTLDKQNKVKRVALTKKLEKNKSKRKMK